MKSVFMCVSVCSYVCGGDFAKKQKKISQKECFVCYILDNKFRVLLYVYVFNAGFLFVGIVREMFRSTLGCFFFRSV